MREISVRLASLGLCEGCEALINIESFPPYSMGAAWRCGSCDIELTNKSFGYEQIGEKWNKTRWVGPDGKWTDSRPVENFKLGEKYYVFAKKV